MNPIRQKARINEIFYPLYTTQKRYILLTGGRGSLKSSTVHDFIIRLTFESGHGVLFTRYTMKSAEKSIIPDFKLVAERLNCLHHFKITKSLITNIHTGSFILFSGIKTNSGDQTANLKSISGITTFVVEEGEDFLEESKFDTIDESVRTKAKQNRVIWIQNPSTREHFIYKKWIEGNSKKIKVHGYDVTISNNPDVEHIHSTYHVALEYLNETWVENANKLKIKNSKKYYHKYIGGWLEKSEGVVYENWSEGDFNVSLPYCYGLDFGYFPDPLAMVKLAVDKKNQKLYIKQEIYRLELSTEDLIKVIKSRIGKRKDLIVCDTNENRTLKTMRKAGLNVVKAHKGKNSVIEGIRKIQDYEIIVEVGSNDIKKELNHYAWNDKKASIPIGEYNHSLDAMRYAFERLNRGRKGISAG